MDWIEGLFQNVSFEGFLGLAMAGGGLAGLIYSSHKGWLGVFSSLWRKADAEIIDVGVNEERDSDGDPSYAPRIHYRYNVDAVDYENRGGQFRILETRGSKDWAEKETRPYAERERVPVYYNPLRHSQSVLEQGCSPQVFIVWGVSLGTLLGGLLLLGVIRP